MSLLFLHFFEHMVNRRKIIQIFKASPTPTAILNADDPDFTYVEVNESYLEMTQRKEKELIGNSLFKAFPANPEEEQPTGVDKLRASFQKVIATKKPDEMPKIRYDIILDDSFRQEYWKVINTPVIDDNGKVEFIINSATNITAQVYSEQINTLMLNNTEDSFIFIDRDLIIQGFNESFAEKYRDIFDVEVQTGSSILDYADPKRRENVKEIYEKVFEGETIEGELPVETANGETRYFSIIYKPVLDDNKNITGSFISLLEKTNEKKAKLELQQKEAQFRSLVEQGGDVVVVLDTDGNPKYITPSVEKVFGYTPEEAKQLNVDEVTHPDDFHHVRNALQKASKTPGHTIPTEPVRMKVKGNEWRWFETSITDLRHEPSVEGFVDNIRDVHEQVITKQLLQQSKENFQNVVEHSTNMFYQHDTEGVLNYVSPQSEKFLGYSPERAMREWTDFITDHPANKEGEKITQKAIETGEAQEPYELQLKTADGRIIWVEVNEAPLKENGSVKGIVGSLTDITDRKKYEKELHKSLERYDYASKATRDAIYDWDILNDNLHWGEGFKTLFGHEPGEGKYPLEKYVESVHPDDKTEALRDLEFTLKDSSMNKWSYEYRFQKADGTFAHVIENGFIIRNEDGKATRMIGAIRDISNAKRVEIQTHLQNEVAQFFKPEDRLTPILDNLLHYLAEYEKFSLTEIWLVSGDKNHLNLISTFARDKTGKKFYSHSKHKSQFKRSEGLPGKVWQHREIQVWENIAQEELFVRNKSAKKAGLESAYGLPLYHNEEVIGVLLLGSDKPVEKSQNKIEAYEVLQEFLGAEIKRKQQEEEMQLLFESSPDILAITSPDEHFVKVNPAFCEIMGYTEEELTEQKYENFVHPEDRNNTRKEYKETITGERNANNFVNRWITKTGEIRWISWSSSEIFGEDHYVFSYGRDITEKAELEQLLNQAQRMARIGGWKLDLRNNELYWSPITKKIHEVEPDFMPDLETGINFYKEGESRETIQKALNVAIKNGSSFDVELQIITANNNERWVRAKAEPIFIDGKCISIYGSFQDITDRKESERELEKAYEEKETILESIGDAFFALDKNWTITYWNKEAENVLGRSKKEVIGKNLWDQYQDAVDLEFYTQYHKAVNEQVSVYFEEYYPTLEKWFDVSAYPSSSGLSVYFKDITDRKVAEKELKEAYKEKETILESIDDGFFTVDHNFIVTYWNLQAERLLQTPRHVIMGENLWDVFDDAIDTLSYTNYHRVLHQKVSVNFEDYFEPLEKWFEVSAYPSSKGMSVFFKDITERKKAQKQLEQLNEELKNQTEELAASNAELEQFAYVASHDLQEPLRMVSSFLTQLEKKYSDQLDDKANQYIHFAVDGAQRMRQIILDLLNYSRLSRGQDNREKSDLNKILEDVQSLERSAIEENKAIINIDPLPTLNVNTGAIKQVFQNLINNAIKYREKDTVPEIKISAEELEEHWRFSVEDNGIGIGSEFKENIFQIFQRLHTREQYSGTGIGLAICKKIIERHHGEIWVESEVGKGSTFYFTLPKE